MIMEKLTRPVEILVVEDNPADVYLFREALKTLPVQTQLHVAGKGDEALAFLRREGLYAEAVRPDLIVLDLNLPGKPGLEVLAEISADSELRHIPSIVLTTSQDEHVIQQSYALCANCYIAKPLEVERFFSLIRTLGEFWFTMVHLPGHA
jgi:CheY-like chemotaxis protein